MQQPQIESPDWLSAVIVIAFMLAVISIPYCCCQVSNEEYEKIKEGMKRVKMEMLKKEQQSMQKEGHINQNKEN